MAASIGRYMRFVVYISSLMLIIIATFFALSTKFDIFGNWRIYSVVTGSMEPDMKVGSLLITRAPQGETEIQKGTVISFAQPGASDRIVTHRVHDIKKIGKENFFVTKGDANAQPDTWRVPYESIKGVYQKQVPYLGSFFQFLQSTPGILLLIILPVLLLAWQEIQTIISILVDRQVNERLGINRIAPPSGGIKVGAVIFLILVMSQVPAAYAWIKSDPVSVAGTTLSAATTLPQITPSATPTPSPTPTVTPTTTPSPTPTPNGTHLVINEVFFNVDSNHGKECVVTEENNTSDENVSTERSRNWVKNSVKVTQTTGENEVSGNAELVNITVGDRTIPISLNNKNFHTSYKQNKCDEWIELYNPTDSEINLKNWKIVDDSGNAYTLNNNCPLPARSYVLVGRSSKTLEKYWPAPDHAVQLYETGRMLGNGLGNEGDHLLLLNAENQLVDSISWGNSATPTHIDGAVAAGQSMARLTHGTDTDNGSDFTILATPTPGQ